MTNFASYTIGSTYTINGVEWTITDSGTRKSKGGRNVRVFTLLSEDGKTVHRTSRGLTYWINGGTGEMTEEQEEAQSNGDLSRAIADAIQPYMDAAVDEATVARIVDERVRSLVPQRVEVVRIDGTREDVGVQHCHFDALLRIVAARLNGWMVGPAGSGKTSAASAAALALGLKFYAKSVGPQTSESSLLGYMDANGKYVRTQLRDAFEFGGVFLLDEVDAGNPAVLVVINALLANGHAAFPDAVIERHKDFVLLAGANTVGQGADRQYVGRQQIDAATLDRFVMIDWDYDPRIEAVAAGVPMSALAGLPMPTPRKFLPQDGAEERCVGLVRRIVAIRNAVAKLGKGVRMIVSPRASKHGCALVRAGWTVDDALDACLWKGMDRDTRSKIECHC